MSTAPPTAHTSMFMLRDVILHLSHASMWRLSCHGESRSTNLCIEHCDPDIFEVENFSLFINILTFVDHELPEPSTKVAELVATSCDILSYYNTFDIIFLVMLMFSWNENYEGTVSL